MAALRIFRLTPTAAPDDPRWDIAINHGTILVRAESAAEARVVAAWSETDFLRLPTKMGGSHSSTPELASAFRDEKLYAVDEDDSGDFPAEGPKGIVSGQLVRGKEDAEKA
jgi:hypothetical protein